MSSISVTRGDRVQRGQVIGYMGDTGTSTGVHCHYEINVDGKSVNPARYFDEDTFFKKRS
jgi:murein DD-endopeptidase MepM/ murein hydrolase activator NlpD